MTRAPTITSAANPLIKDVRRAVLRGGLTSEGLCVAESRHLLEEALRSGCEVRAVLVAENTAPVDGPSPIVVPEDLFRTLSTTETSQGVIALVRPPVWMLQDLLRGVPLVVVLDALQDPGNVGTIVRAAEAFGATGVVFLKGTASPHNPKTLRASAGSLFRVPYLYDVDEFPLEGLAVYAGVSGAPASIGDADFDRPAALIVGNEASGVSQTLLSRSMEVGIPTTGVESLNAAMAAAIMLYEARRQRKARG